jgi:hypothetical protein
MNNIERQLHLSILIWGRKVSLLSKRRPKKLVSETILIGELYNFNSGSGWSPLLLQKCIPRSLYVDDFLVCYRGKNMNNIERQLQLCLNKIEKWAMALRLLFFSILIWGRKVSLLSKRRPTNLVSETILIGELYNSNSGSGWSQEMRVPQGSILSVTLFSIKINSLAKIVNDNIEGSLYVDDFCSMLCRILFLNRKR